MELIKWDEKSYTKIQLIDEQQAGFIDLINKLYDAMKDGQGNKKPENIFDDLVEYTKTHFLMKNKLWKNMIIL
jgi:hemerythrin